MVMVRLRISIKLDPSQVQLDSRRGSNGSIISTQYVLHKKQEHVQMYILGSPLVSRTNTNRSAMRKRISRRRERMREGEKRAH
jgi:hypothetical protein